MTEASEGPRRPAPRPSPQSREFWAATKEHRLVIQRCGQCGGYEWTPQMVCSRCFLDTLQWVEASGKGEIYSYSVVHRAQGPAFQTPYVVAIVELSEGVRMLTSLVDVSPEDVKIGMPVRVAFRDLGELALYEFTPDPGHAKE